MTADSTSFSIPVALVGCGAVARLFYAPALRELERHRLVEVVALADPSADARRVLAAAFPRARAYADAREAFAGGVQLAIIASPPKFHRAQTEAALAAGLDVLCEKPLAPTSGDCAAMITAAEHAGRVLAVGHYKRFFPAHRALKHFIDHRTFGWLESLEINEGGKFAWPAASDSFFRKEQTPGGVLLDIGVHVLDLLLWWLGEPSEFSYADDAMGGLEANCRLDATWYAGARAVVRLSRDWPTPDAYCFRFNRATVICRVNRSNQLELTLDGLPMTLAAELRDPLPPRPAPPTAALETNPQAFLAQLVDVCAAVCTPRAPTISGDDGLRAIRWIERCYAARQWLPQGWMEPPAAPPAAPV